MEDQKASIQTDVKTWDSDRAEDLGGEVHNELQGMQMQGPAPGKEKSHAPIQADLLESSSVEQGVLVENKLTMIQQHGLVTKKTSGVLVFLRKTVANKMTEEILPLYSARIRPCLKYHTQFWAPQFKEDKERLERVW